MQFSQGLRKFRVLLSILCSVVLLVVVIGGTAIAAPRSAQKAPKAAMFVPQRAAVMVSLLVNPEQLGKLPQKLQPENIQQIGQSLLSGTDLNYKRDVQPWVGEEVTLAVTTPDLDRDAQNGKQPGYLLAIATKDATKAREFLQLFWQKRALAGIDLVYEQYKGVKFIYSNALNPVTLNAKGKKSSSATPELTPELATALVGDQFLLLANHPKVLRDAINNVQAAELALPSAGAYQQALSSFTQDRVALAFVNPQQVANWVSPSQQGVAAKPEKKSKGKQKPEPEKLAETSTNLETAPLYDSLAIGLGVNRQGLLAETALLTTSGKTLEPASPQLSQPVGALQYLPETSLIAAAGSDLSKFWSQVNQGVTGYEGVSSLLGPSLKNLQTAWGVDLPKDIFSWVKGEYALGALQHLGQEQLDWVFVVQKSAEVEAGIKHLDELAQQKGYSVGPLTLDKQQVSAWTRLATAPASAKSTAPLSFQAEIRGLHATVGNYEILTNSVEAMDQVLQSTQKPLLNNADFKAVVKVLPQPNDGYLYINWLASQAVLEKQVPFLKFLELVANPLFSNLKSITLSSYGSETTVKRSQIFFRLAA